MPPLLTDVRGRLDPGAHPFHRHSDVELFLALRDGTPVGRIAAVHNRRHVAFQEEPVGFFGFFETERDPAVARALLGAAGEWLAERGLEAIRGPASFSTNEESGLLVEGFDSPPTIMMPYNPPWYADLLEGAGFRKARDLVTYLREGNEPPAYLVRASETVGKRYPGVTIRSLRMGEFEREVETILRLYNEAWEENWGFVPMTEAEFRHMAKELRPAVVPELALVAEDGEGRAIGFALSLPDYHRAIRHARGRLFPLGLARILWHRRSIDLIRVLTLGIVEEYRGKGVDALLYLETFRASQRLGYHDGEFGWVLEDNERMRRPLERMGAHVNKRYRFYERPVGG